MVNRVDGKQGRNTVSANIRKKCVPTPVTVLSNPQLSGNIYGGRSRVSNSSTAKCLNSSLYRVRFVIIHSWGYYPRFGVSVNLGEVHSDPGYFAPGDGKDRLASPYRPVVFVWE
jgi:hypothetical protein